MQGGEKMKAQSYKDLEVYRLSFDLAKEIHKMTLNLPKYEMYEEGSQIRRSAKAIPANLAEGFGRRKYKNDYLRFLIYAHASCDETKVHLDMLYETGSLENRELYENLKKGYSRLSIKIYNFIESVIDGHNQF
jgi:four helix bundle protein